MFSGLKIGKSSQDRNYSRQESLRLAGPERDRRRERTLLNNNDMNEIYWITRLDAIQTLAIIAVFILGVLTSISIIGWFVDDDFENESKFKNMAIKCAAYISIPIFLLLFIPSKRDMLMIIGIGGTIEYLKSNDTANKLPDKVIMAIDKLLDDTIEEENE